MHESAETSTSPQIVSKVASNGEDAGSPSTEINDVMSLTQRRKRLQGKEKLTPEQVTDGVLELNRLVDEQTTDAGDHIRELHKNYALGLSAALKAGDPMLVGFMSERYGSMEAELIGYKLRAALEPELPPAAEKDQPFGFTPPQANTEAAPQKV